MTEAMIIAEYEASSKNAKMKAETVNRLRHLMMDSIVIDVKDNSTYIGVYTRIMGNISSQYPPLSQEVKRQIDKKIRWQARRSLEEQSEAMHF